MKNLTYKEIIENAQSELAQAIEVIKKLQAQFGTPIGEAEAVTELEMFVYDMEQSVERLETIKYAVCEEPNEVKTKFGSLFVEPLIGVREEVDRIKIFDSNKKYMDYFDVEHLQNCANEMGYSLNQEYSSRINNFIIANTIEDLTFLIYSYEDFKTTKNWEEAAEFLELDFKDPYRTAIELEQNEYVNKVGDYYIVLSD